MVAKSFLVYLLFGAVHGRVAGSYKASTTGITQICASPPEIILKENGNLVKTTCTGNGSTVTFGKWIQPSPDTVVEFLVDGTSEVKIQENPQENTLVYGNLNLKKVEPTVLDLAAVANLFGEWKTPQHQSRGACAVISGLSIMNNGQFIRYFCKRSSRGWMEKGFFRIKSYKDSNVTFSANVNSTTTTLTLVSDGPDKLTYENVTLTRVA